MSSHKNAANIFNDPLSRQKRMAGKLNEKRHPGGGLRWTTSVRDEILLFKGRTKAPPPTRQVWSCRKARTTAQRSREPTQDPNPAPRRALLPSQFSQC